SQAGKSTLPYYFIGIATLLSYLPLYWYRKRIEDRRDPAQTHDSDEAPAVATSGSSP
ncbi:MAG: hypothetical protein JOY58_08610, partial [Solirubrobacterales bacterium]|nr:hypothetical protein [Solirubrobacterales bacterium]